MDAGPNTRRLNRERKPVAPQAPRGTGQIVLPMSRPLYDEIWRSEKVGKGRSEKGQVGKEVGKGVAAAL